MEITFYWTNYLWRPDLITLFHENTLSCRFFFFRYQLWGFRYWLSILNQQLPFKKKLFLKGNWRIPLHFNVFDCCHRFYLSQAVYPNFRTPVNSLQRIKLLEAQTFSCQLLSSSRIQNVRMPLRVKRLKSLRLDSMYWGLVREKVGYFPLFSWKNFLLYFQVDGNLSAEDSTFQKTQTFWIGKYSHYIVEETYFVSWAMGSDSPA